MEKLELKSPKSQIKVFGTLVSISGALIMTLYKGPPVLSPPIQPHLHPSPSTMLTTSNNWLIGGLFIATASLSLSANIVGQAAVLKGYPSEIMLVSFYCLFGTIQSALVTLLFERDPNAWMLSPDIELISVVYSALFGNVVTFGVQAWCIRRKGPVFVASFKPLSIAIAAFLGFIFLGETLYIGSGEIAPLGGVSVTPPPTADGRWEWIYITNFTVTDLSYHRRRKLYCMQLSPLLPKLNNEIIILILLCSFVGAAIIVTGFYGVIWAQSDKEEVGKTTTTPLLDGHDVDA
ncbi:hypothetical protein Goari_026152 [Gossypium aridum]|uniref:WAT1-related protein n=1 Tax=Gossypium aridum TaxID=34290 RepID=A0A7J8XBW5_GOSAI|nr:hypothetical protein [Gossypium aridum]